MFFGCFENRQCFGRRKKKMAPPVEYSHLPPEIHQMISERCSYGSRRNLQLTCRAMKSIVDSSKSHINAVKITEKPHNGVRLTFVFYNYWEVPRNYEQAELGAIVNRRAPVPGKSPVDLALADFRKFCIRKNVTSIGCVHLETMGDSGELVEKMEALLMENKRHLKIGAIEWERNTGTSQLGWSFLKFTRLESLNSIRVFGLERSKLELFNLVEQHTLSRLNCLEVLMETDASPEDVLALNASRIHLQSENFTAELMIEMLYKWMEDSDKPVGAMIVLKNTKTGNMAGNLTERVPNSFQRVASYENHVHRFKLTLANWRVMILRVGQYGISVEIQNPTPTPFEEFSQQQREKCLKRIGCRCNSTSRTVDFGFLSNYDEDADDIGDFVQSSDDSDDGGYEYEDDDGGWRSDLDDSDLDEFLQFDD